MLQEGIMSVENFIQQWGGISEEYFFYNGETTLRYFDKEHSYHLVTEDGDLERQDGVTNVCHIIDKSEALVPWGCKMMQGKLLRTAPFVDGGDMLVMTRADVETWVMAAKDAHKEKLEDAGAVGHIAHNWIESYIKLILLGEIHLAAALRAILPYEERAAQASRAAFDWMDKHNVRWRATERKVYSRLHKYAGTMDGLCVCDSCDDTKCCPEPFTDRLTIADWKTSNYLYMEYLFQTAAYQFAYMEETEEIVLDRWIIRLGKEDGEFEAWHREPHNFEMDLGGFLDALKMTRTVKAVELNLRDRADNIRAALKAERDAARAIKEALEAEERAIAKAKKAQERLEALAKECPKAKKYKGSRKPTCTTKDDGPCSKCQEIYGLAHAHKPVTVTEGQKKSRKKREKFLEGTTPESLKANRNRLSSLMAVLGEGNVEEKQDVASVVVSSEAPVRCDGEHGGGQCGDSNCWDRPCTPEELAEMESLFVIPQRSPQLLLTAKSSPWRYLFIDVTNTLDTDVPSVVK